MPVLLYEITIAIVVFIVLLFTIFYIVVEGSSWQKHRILGIFARFIQASFRRSFFVFLSLMIVMPVACAGVLMAYWMNAVETNTVPNNTTPIVTTLLVILLLLAIMLPVTWGRFRTWRQAVRSAAEVRIRTVE